MAGLDIVTPQTIRTHRANLISCQVDGEVIILDQLAGAVHPLNDSASHSWRACDGSRSADDIAAYVAADFDGVPGTLLEDVLTTLSDLGELGLLVDANTSAQPTTDAQE